MLVWMSHYDTVAFEATSHRFVPITIVLGSVRGLGLLFAEQQHRHNFRHVWDRSIVPVVSIAP